MAILNLQSARPCPIDVAYEPMIFRVRISFASIFLILLKDRASALGRAWLALVPVRQSLRAVKSQRNGVAARLSGSAALLAAETNGGGQGMGR